MAVWKRTITVNKDGAIVLTPEMLRALKGKVCSVDLRKKRGCGKRYVAVIEAREPSAIDVGGSPAQNGANL